MKLVAANGCFDPLHYGHMLHLSEGRRYGDRLIVFLTTAAHVNKGPGRPVFTDEQRAFCLMELKCVDEVIINPDPLPHKLIEKYRPDFYIKDQEYIGRLPEQKLVESLGGKVIFTNSPKFSSTQLLSFYK